MLSNPTRGGMREQLLEHLRAIGFDVWRINERSRQLDPVGARIGLPWRGQSVLRSPVRVGAPG